MGLEPLRGILCSEPVSDKRGRRVTAKGIGSAHVYCPGQLLCPPAEGRLGHPVPTDGGGSWPSLDTYNPPL